MRNIRKEFPGIVANDDITLQLKRERYMPLLGENGAGKSTLMSVLFGLYQPEQGTIYKNGQKGRNKGSQRCHSPWDERCAPAFKLIDVFTLSLTIILGGRDHQGGFPAEKRGKEKKFWNFPEEYGLKVDVMPRWKNITVNAARWKSSKCFYRGNETYIFDEPTWQHAAGNRMSSWKP